MSDRLSSWMAGYRRAWESNRPDDIRALFTDDATYRTEPWTEPWRGIDQIVSRWLDRKDEPDTSTFEWWPITETPELAVVEGVTRYTRGVTYSNLWIIQFADHLDEFSGDASRATAYTEWWMDQAEPS
jgi:hypothetical protein